MSLGATLAAGGMRPASFLPTIKCSSCGDEIEISAMGDHICTKAPPSPKSQPASLSNPFTLRQMNANNSKPAQPSPLQFDNPPPQTRSRAPTLGSSAPPSSRIPRAPLPQINPDAANKPFLAPLPRPASPISPAASSRSGSSLSGRPSAPQRSVTMPAPRLWDPRPPSPELSANLDCAFPPFPLGDSTPGSRPGSSNGRNTPSERGSSRAESRQDGRFPDVSMAESPANKGNENLLSRMNTLKSGPFDPAQSNAGPLDRRRPSIVGRHANAEVMPPLPPMPLSNVSKPAEATYNIPSQTHANGTDGNGVDRKMAPQRPTRPETLPQGLLDNIAPAAAASTPSKFPLPPQSLRPTQQSRIPSPTRNTPNDIDTMPTLTKVPSEPALRGRSGRPSMPESSKTEPPVYPNRSTSRVGTSRIDHRMQDAPPVPKPVQQLNRSNSHHRPSGSDSSSASSTRSIENSNTSSLGASPVTSAASSVDAFSPLSNEVYNLGREKSTRSNARQQDNPGMRAEMPKQRKSPPRNFARPVAPTTKPTAPPEPPLESPVLPASSNWPLESPIDPEMRDGRIIGNDEDRSDIPLKASPIAAPNANLTPGYGLSPADFLSDDYDPYRPISPRTDMAPKGFPQPPKQPVQTRPRSRTNVDAPPPRPLSPPPVPAMPRAITPTLTRSKTFDVVEPLKPTKYTPRSQSIPKEAPRKPNEIPLPPPIPRDPTPAPLSRQPTSKKPTCRACALPIASRAVKAADGRLTGRWHKECFVCRSCSSPFPNGDFYVLRDHPYCEQHYHEENGSLCAGCCRGIEGEYLETSSSAAGGGERKFHPRCFTCATCRGVLAEDYFEIGGRVFCERHAVAAMRPAGRPGPPGTGPRMGGAGLPPPSIRGLGAPGLRAERRTTKLMTMG